MKSIILGNQILRLNFFCATLLLFFSFSMNAQFQIVGMQYNGQFANSANLTILSPKGQPFSGTVPFDPNKQYASGTTFRTTNGTSISVLCKGQTQIVAPNATLKVSLVNNGIKAETLSGSVKHVLKDVKSKLSFYKAGNGYTWAHAEGTVFEVEAYSKSKKARFSTQEGTIAIIEEVPISINEAAKNQIDRNGKADERQLTASRKTINTVGDTYITENIQPIQYATYKEAVDAFDDETYAKNEHVNLNYPDWTLIEQLADDFMLLGGLYLENGQPDMAIDPLRYSVAYTSATDPGGILILESYLYLSEALILSEDESNYNEGMSMATTIVESLNEVLDESIIDFDYATANQDDELAWDIAQEIIDICEYLGWSHDLLGETQAADQYYDLVDQYKE
jgi:hypothetical protein